MNTPSVKINFRGFEISIGMSECWVGCNILPMRPAIMVNKDGKEVAMIYSTGRSNTDNNTTLEVDGEVLFGVMREIIKKDPVGPIRLPEGDGAIEY